MSAACGYAAGQQAYAVYQNGEAVTVKDVEKNIKVLEMAAQTGCPVVTFYNSVGAKLTEGLDVLTANAKLNAQIAKVSGVIPQVAVVLGVCGGTSALLSLIHIFVRFLLGDGLHLETEVDDVPHPDNGHNGAAHGHLVHQDEPGEHDGRYRADEECLGLEMCIRDRCERIRPTT